MPKVGIVPIPVYDKELNCYRVPLSGGKEALVDPEDLPLIMRFKWSCQAQKGYAITQQQMHRLVMNAHFGDPRQVDHINNNILDNRKCNLRFCTPSENCKSRIKQKVGRHGKPCSSRFKGVSYLTHNAKGNGKPWKASLTVNMKLVHIGMFHDEIEAARAYDAAAIIHFGEFAKTNASLGLLPPVG